MLPLGCEFNLPIYDYRMNDEMGTKNIKITLTDMHMNTVPIRSYVHSM